MKHVVLLGVLALASADAFAQRGPGAPSHAGGMGAGTGRAGFGRNARGPGAGRFNQRLGRRSAGLGFYPYALWDGDYDYDYGYPPYEPAAAPSTIAVQPVQLVPPEPPHIGQSVIHTYSTGAGNPGAEPPTFAIARTDGSRVEATAVWVQDGFVHYVDPDDRAGQVALASIDRAATRKLNQDRNLTLQLPAQ